MNPHLARLQPYPFEKLAALKAGVTPPADKTHIALSIGEPQHPAPQVVKDAIVAALDGLAKYPTIAGEPALREAIAAWAGRRFHLGAAGLDPDTQLLPVTGTREALFAIAQVVLDPTDKPLVLMPNPFYQIYEGAALLAGGQPVYLNCDEELGFQPDLNAVDETTWQRCGLVYLCSPGNPTGAVANQADVRDLLEKADRYGFVVCADECYSEIYFNEDAPPKGLLQHCVELGRPDYRNVLVFHSLSKRSNLPGMRSGFVAGDAALIAAFRRYRTYHGCTLPPPAQAGSIAAWNDEAHVLENRSLYRQKFDAVIDILSPVLEVERPDAGFYLWPRVGGDETGFARALFAAEHVTVLPGRFLGRETAAGNPGEGRVRMALVASVADCIEAATRIRHFLTAHRL